MLQKDELIDLQSAGYSNTLINLMVFCRTGFQPNSLFIPFICTFVHIFCLDKSKVPLDTDQ